MTTILFVSMLNLESAIEIKVCMEKRGREEESDICEH